MYGQLKQHQLIYMPFFPHFFWRVYWIKKWFRRNVECLLHWKKKEKKEQHSRQSIAGWMENRSQFSALFNWTISSVFWSGILVSPPPFLRSVSDETLHLFFLRTHTVGECNYCAFASASARYQWNFRLHTSRTTDSGHYAAQCWLLWKWILRLATTHHKQPRSVFLSLPFTPAHFQCNGHADISFHKYVHY